MSIHRIFHPTIRGNKIISTKIDNILDHKESLNKFQRIWCHGKFTKHKAVRQEIVAKRLTRKSLTYLEI